MITYIYMYIYMYTYLYIYMYIYIYISFNININVCIYIYMYGCWKLYHPPKKTGSSDSGDGEVQGGTSLGPGTCQPGSTRRGPWGPGRGRCSRGKSMEIWVLSGDFMGFDVDFME